MGFRLGSDKSATKSAKKNLQSAVEHPSIVDDYLQKELLLGRISGPYPLPKSPH